MMTEGMTQEAIGHELYTKLMLERDRYGDIETMRGGLIVAGRLLAEYELEQDALHKTPSQEIKS